MWARILNEPTMLIDALRAILTLIVMLGWWHLDNPTQTQILLTFSLVLALVNRALVTPNTSLSVETQAAAKLSPPGPPA
jgi:hypothetical protein